MKHLFAAAALLAFFFLTPFAAGADRERWLETDSWSGTGMKTTRIFRVNADKWRIIAQRHASGPRYIHVFNKANEEVGKVLVSHHSAMSVKAFKGKGEYYLVMPDADGEWSVKIHQKLSIAEEWELRKALKEPPPSLLKLGSWSGEAGTFRYNFTVPENTPWRLVCTGETSDAGNIRIRVARLGTVEKSDFVYATAGEIDCLQWFYRGGEYELNIEVGKATWQTEVQSAQAP